MRARLECVANYVARIESNNDQALMSSLVGVQEARVARETVRSTRMELAVSEAERARLVIANRTAEASQRALRVQLAEAGTAYRAAMTTAQNFLNQGESFES